MVTNSLRLEDIRWDEVKDLTRIQNQNGIKHNRMGQEKTGVFQLQIRYASYSANEWLDPIKKPPRLRGLFSFQRHPHRGTIPGWGTLRVWASAAGA